MHRIANVTHRIARYVYTLMCVNSCEQSCICPHLFNAVKVLNNEQAIRLQNNDLLAPSRATNTALQADQKHKHVKNSKYI
jgi:hypothetical protein